MGYGIICYGSAYQNQVQRVKRVINRSLKLVFNTTVLSSDLLKRKNVLDFDMAYRYFCTIKMYRILCLNEHESLALKINSFQNIHDHETRAVSNLIQKALRAVKKLPPPDVVGLQSVDIIISAPPSATQSIPPILTNHSM